MRDNIFLDSAIPEDTKRLIAAFLKTEATDFSTLVELGEFDITSDFRHSDLSGIDLSGADLRGFDFTGADLRNTLGRDVLFDETTILTGAHLENSVFEIVKRKAQPVVSEAFPSIQRLNWPDQVIWLEQNLREDRRPDTDHIKAAALLLASTRESFVRRQALQAIARVSDVQEVINFIEAEIFERENQDINLIASAFHVIETCLSRDRLGCITFLLKCVSKPPPIAIGATKLLVQALPGKEDLQRLGFYMGKRESRVVRSSFIGELADSLGVVEAAVVRHPTTMEIFDFESEIPGDAIRLIVRNLDRKLSDERDVAGARKPFSAALGYQKRVSKKDVLAVYGALNSYGLRYWTRDGLIE